MSLFITFEGIEGCGKTTQSKLLSSLFEKIHRPFLLTREPGGTPVGDRIRQILLAPESGGIEPMAELFLYIAARVQHLNQVIIPAVRQGKVVLCDRFADATVAYQGYGRGLDITWLAEIHGRAMANWTPDLTFLFDLPVEEGLQRAWKRMEGNQLKEDRFEREDLDFHRRVREGYLLLASKEPKRMIVLDGSKDPSALHQEVLSHLPAELRSHAL
ncbi:MAG: dTMP kinase [Deltaproteobacteria bacterium]|nr:dTMP kinase [Deltaproteobacteria bacterium]